MRSQPPVMTARVRPQPGQRFRSADSMTLLDFTKSGGSQVQILSCGVEILFYVGGLDHGEMATTGGVCCHGAVRR